MKQYYILLHNLYSYMNHIVIQLKQLQIRMLHITNLDQSYIIRQSSFIQTLMNNHNFVTTIPMKVFGKSN